MADIETSESNQRNDRFASLTDSDLDKLLLEKDAANTRKITDGRVPRKQMSPVLRKPVFGVSDHVRHKPGCDG